MVKNITTVSFLILFILLHARLGMASEQKLLKDIRFDSLSKTEERISFQLNGAYIPKIFAIKGERPRVVFDFPDVRPARLLKNRFNTNGKFIKRIRVGIHNKPDAKTRVVFDLMPDNEIDFKQDFDKQKNTLTITVYHAGSEPESKAELPEAKKEISPEQPVQAEKTAQDSDISKTTVPNNEPPAVKEQATPTPEVSVPDQTMSKPAEPVKATAELPVPEQTMPKPAEPIKPTAELPVPEQTVTKAAEPVKAIPAEVTKPAPVQIQAKPAPSQPEETQPEQQPAAPEINEQPPTVKTPPALPAAGQTILSSITFDNSTNRGEMVFFQLNEFHSPIVFGVEEGGPRIVCDFKNTAAADDLPDIIKTDGKLVHSIRIGLETTPQRVRVVLDLAPGYRYDLQQVFFKDNNKFAVIINTLQDKTKSKELNRPGQ